MKISRPHRRILLIFSTILLLFLALRWAGKSAVEYIVTNYFHQKLSGSSRTTIEYDIGNLHLEWGERSIELDEVEILVNHQEATGGTTSYELSLPLFKIDLLSLRTLFLNYTLSIEDIILENPSVQVYLPEVQDTVVFREEMGNLQQRTLSFLQQLDLQNFALKHGSFAWARVGITLLATRLEILACTSIM